MDIVRVPIPIEAEGQLMLLIAAALTPAVIARIEAETAVKGRALGEPELGEIRRRSLNEWGLLANELLASYQRRSADPEGPLQV